MAEIGSKSIKDNAYQNLEAIQSIVDMYGISYLEATEIWITTVNSIEQLEALKQDAIDKVSDNSEKNS